MDKKTIRQELDRQRKVARLRLEKSRTMLDKIARRRRVREAIAQKIELERRKKLEIYAKTETKVIFHEGYYFAMVFFAKKWHSVGKFKGEQQALDLIELSRPMLESWRKRILDNPSE